MWSRTALLPALLLAGCGFQLQGRLTPPAAMEHTYIAAADRYTPFYRELRRELTAAGVDVVDTPAAATATLTIAIDDTGQRVLSVSARNVPTEYEVYYSVQYSLTSGAQSLLEPQFLTLTADYTYNERQVLGKAREEDLQRDAIVRDLVRIVLKQLSLL